MFSAKRLHLASVILPRAVLYVQFASNVIDSSGCKLWTCAILALLSSLWVTNRVLGKSLLISSAKGV